MTVYDFLNLATEDDAEVEIFIGSTGESVTINIEAAKELFGDKEINSWDSYVEENLCLNIDEETPYFVLEK